jgi:hypothetical protein
MLSIQYIVGEKFIGGVVDTGEQFIGGVVDTGEQFIGGVVDIETFLHHVTLTL